MTDIQNGGQSSRFKLLKIFKQITSNILKEEIARRKIPFDLASQHLQQAFVLDRKNQRKYMAFTFKNSLDVNEIIIPFPVKKANLIHPIGAGSFSLIDGLNKERIEIFKSIWDFLTWQTMTKQPSPKFRSYILNNSKYLERAFTEIIHQHHATPVYSILDFLENDELGVYYGEVDHVIPWQTDQGFSSRRLVVNVAGALSKIMI